MKSFKRANIAEIEQQPCTQILFCQANEKPLGDWIECDPSEIKAKGCQSLYVQAGVRYFGYL